MGRSLPLPGRRRALWLSAANALALLLARHDAFGQATNARTELEIAARRAGLCSSTNAVGVGLRGEYFAEEAWRGEVLLTRTDATIDFDPGFEWPASQSTRRPKSVRWSGWVKPPLPGHYRFHCDAPGARLSVSRQLVGGAGSPGDTPVKLDAGRFVPVVLELPSVAGLTGRVRLEWTAPHGARFLIARPLLHLPTETVALPAK